MYIYFYTLSQNILACEDGNNNVKDTTFITYTTLVVLNVGIAYEIAPNSGVAEWGIRHLR